MKPVFSPCPHPDQSLWDSDPDDTLRVQSIIPTKQLWMSAVPQPQEGLVSAPQVPYRRRRTSITVVIMLPVAGI